jgi:hypothetical protein
MKVKSFFKDVGGADRVTKRRETLFKDASPKEDFSDPINAVAKELHPDPFEVKVSKAEDVSPTARKYTFVPTKGVLPPFQAGQYVSLRFQIGKTLTCRPYSICSAPFQARGKDPLFRDHGPQWPGRWLRRELHLLFLERRDDLDRLDAFGPFLRRAASR